MERIYANLRLMGYKVKELSNGYFIAKRPDGAECLFDNNGNAIKNNLTNIEQLSDVLYIGKDYCTKEHILFDNRGNVVEVEHKGEDKDIGSISNLVKSVDNNSGNVRLYEKNLKATFNISMESKIQEAYDYVIKIIKHKGEFKVAVMSNLTNTMKLIDTKLQITDVPVKVYNYENMNNHYITKYFDDLTSGDMRAIDYEGNLICEGKYVYIDSLNMDNDTIIVYTGDSIEVYSASRGTKKCIPMSNKVHNIRFTSKPNVIIISEQDHEYLLDIGTLEKSEHYNRIYTSQIATRNSDVYVLDTSTFKHEIMFRSIIDIRISNGRILICNKEGNKYYNLGFKPLLREF